MGFTWSTGAILTGCPSGHQQWLISITARLEGRWKFSVLTTEPRHRPRESGWEWVRKTSSENEWNFFSHFHLVTNFWEKKYHRYCAKSSRMLRSRLGLFHMSVLLFCGAGHEKRRGEQLKWSLAFRLYIGRSPCAQLPGPVHTAGTAECVF